MSEPINKLNMPKHIAITMDGNGRWAKERGKKRVFGHNNGVKSVRDTIEGAVEYGVKFLTLFAFSTENWKRPKAEVNALMTLLVKSIHNETKDLIKNNMTYLEREPLENVCKRKNLCAYKHRGFWQCVDTKRDLEKLKKIIK